MSPAIDTAVVSVGHIAGGDFGAPNIIPSEVVVRGTSRSYKPAVRDLLQKRLTELAHALAGAYGCTAEVDYDRRYPPLVNHAEQTAVSVAAAAALVGAENVNGDAPQLTGSEDFSFMLESRPGGFVMIGNGVEPDGSFHNVHTPALRFQRRNPDARRGLLGQPRAAGTGGITRPRSSLRLRKRGWQSRKPRLQFTPSFFCRLVDDVVYWNSSFLSG